MKKFIAVLSILASLGLSACQTVQGIGEDLEQLGGTIQGK